MRLKPSSLKRSLSLQSLKPWWSETRGNLDRLIDRVSDLESGETIAPVKEEVVTAVGDTMIVGDLDDLFDPTSKHIIELALIFLVRYIVNSVTIA